MSYIATFVHTYVYIQETLVQAADSWTNFHGTVWSGKQEPHTATL